MIYYITCNYTVLWFQLCSLAVYCIFNTLVKAALMMTAKAIGTCW